MLRHLALALAAFLMPLAGSSASAQSGPVVVELFTSQGCSSCPPADAFLAELAQDPDVLALAFHVDYWDRLGWKDTFGSRAFTQRQYDYAAALGNRMVWTPQFVVGGTEFTRGNFKGMVRDYVERMSAQPAVAVVAVRKAGGGHVATVSPGDGSAGSAEIVVAGFSPRSDVRIERGENAGHTLTYVNTVHSWERLASWNGRGPVDVTIPASVKPPFAVLVQRTGLREILAAAAVR